MLKKVVCSIIACTLGLSLCACTNNTTQEVNTIDKASLSAVETALSNLEAYENPYIISNMLEAPDGVIQYLECTSDNGSYTEYSVDSDGNIGTITYGSSESIAYAMTDWLTTDGQYYIFQSDEEGNDLILSLPKGYSEFVDGRDVMYLDELLANLKSLERDEDMTMDLGQGEEKFSIYSGVVSSDAVKNILGVSSYGIYKSIYDEVGADSNIGKLCDYYLEDLDMSLTFSDAFVTIGIDKDNLPKYVCIEVGGLGTRLYFTKVIVEPNNTNVRSIPDFSTATAYSDTLSELANYLAEHESIEAGFEALTSEVVNTDSTVAAE